jgi:MFS family permease
MAVIKTYGQLVALRTLVGVLEAGFAPGILLILSSWYKKEEQSKRFAVYISAAVLSGAFGGIIAGAITGYDICSPGYLRSTDELSTVNLMAFTACEAGSGFS